MLKFYKLIIQGFPMVIMRKIIKLLLPILLTTTSIHAQETDFSELSSIVDSFIDTSNKLKEQTNTAGKQRMLTQRMTKLALLIEEDIKRKKNIKKLNKSTKQYINNLKTLESDNPEIHQQLQIIKILWVPFLKNIENIIQRKEEKKSLKYLVDNNEKLRQSSNKLVSIYENSEASLNYLDKAKLNIVNLAGRQRMLLEKMSKEKILLFKKHKEYQKRLSSSINDFDQAIQKLKKGDKERHIPRVTNPKLIEKLTVIEPLWQELKPLYKKKNLTKKELSKLIRKSSLLLLESNIYVKLIEVETEY
jgi:hypothetical protein